MTLTHCYRGKTESQVLYLTCVKVLREPSCSLHVSSGVAPVLWRQEYKAVFHRVARRRRRLSLKRPLLSPAFDKWEPNSRRIHDKVSRLAAKVTEGGEPFNIYDECRISEISPSLAGTQLQPGGGRWFFFPFFVFNRLVIAVAIQTLFFF